MLQDTFYRIKSRKTSGILDNPSGFIKDDFQVSLDPGHPIYKGHFPGNPVVPGVCQVQMIKELVSLILEKEVRMIKADNIKYLSLIVPGVYDELHVSIEINRKPENYLIVKAVISANEVIFLKFKGGYVPFI